MSEQTPPADTSKKINPLEHQTYSLYFALSGFILVIGSVWAIWDETYTRRPWKSWKQWTCLPLRRSDSTYTH